MSRRVSTWSHSVVRCVRTSRIVRCYCRIIFRTGSMSSRIDYIGIPSSETLGRRSIGRNPQLLGQRAHRELLQQPEKPARPRNPLHHLRPTQDRHLRLHRALLQPKTTPLHARLQIANPVHQRLEERSTAEKTGRMRTTRWKTKYTGNLRLFSVYHDRNGAKFYIITECDRSATTVLFPEDY